jgi:hypothetical protein
MVGMVLFVVYKYQARKNKVRVKTNITTVKILMEQKSNPN